MAIEFVGGSTENITCGSDASIDDIAQITLTCWAYPHAIDGRLADKRGSTAGWSWFLNGTGSVMEWYRNFSGDDGRWKTDAGLTANVWQHLAVTYDKGATTHNPVLYVNGVARAITESSTPTGTADSEAALALEIGRISGAASPYDGLMEDFRVLNRIATAEEIALLAAGYRGVLGGEVLWLSMNEAREAAGAWEGTSLANGTNLLPDLSANSNDGDPVNTPTGRASKAPRYGVCI